MLSKYTKSLKTWRVKCPFVYTVSLGITDNLSIVKDVHMGIGAKKTFRRLLKVYETVCYTGGKTEGQKTLVFQNPMSR